MSENFIIRETVDSSGHRVIVYEFPGTEGQRPSRPDAAAAPRRRSTRGRIATNSFIKVTFESRRAGGSGASNAEGSGGSPSVS